jgi:hypothetical protein
VARSVIRENTSCPGGKFWICARFDRELQVASGEGKTARHRAGRQPPNSGWAKARREKSMLAGPLGGPGAAKLDRGLKMGKKNPATKAGLNAYQRRRSRMKHSAAIACGMSPLLSNLDTHCRGHVTLQAFRAADSSPCQQQPGRGSDLWVRKIRAHATEDSLRCLRPHCLQRPLGKNLEPVGLRALTNVLAESVPTQTGCL